MDMNKRGGITTSLKRNKFGLIILVTAVMVGATLFGLSRWITIKIEGEKTIDFVNEWFPILRGSSNRVTHLITWIDNELEQLSQLEEIHDPGVNLESEIIDVTYRSLSNYISCLRRLDEEGNRVFGYHGECDPIDSTLFEGDQDYFLAAKRAKKLSTSDIFIDSEGQKRLRVVHPILRDCDNGDQEFAGALTVDVKVDEIQKMMIPPLSETEREWLRILWFDSNNGLICFPGHPNVDGRAILEFGSNCRTCHDSSREFARLRNRVQGWEIIEDGRGGKMVTLFTPVQFADQNWMIALRADYESVIAEAEALANYIQFIAALSCIIVLFGAIVSFSMVRARKTADVRDQVLARESALLGKIKESEERYRTLFEGVRSGVYVSTPQGKFLDVNEAMVRMLGYDSSEELLEIDIESDLYVLPNDRKSFKEKIEKHIVIEDHESRLRRKDGKHIICLETSYGRRDENGRIVEYLGVLIDISSRKRMEAELENSRYRLRELFDGASVAIFVEDMQGNILDVNRKAIELFGYGRDEFLEMHAIDLLAPEDARKFDLFWEALAKRGSIDLETRNRTKGGHFIDVEVIAQMVTMEKETLIQVFVRDVSEIRQKERELREKNEELNTLHEISKIVSQSLMPEEILELTIQKIIEVTPFDTGTIYSYDTNSRTLHLASSFGIPEDHAGIDESIPFDEAITGRVASNREILILDSVSNAPGSVAKQIGSGLHAYIGIPILFGQQLLGVINLASFTTLKRESYRISLLKGVGELLGMAISNANLYHESQKRASEMAVLYEAGKTFMAITHIDQLARKVVEVARTELGYEACAILSLNEEKKEISILDAAYLQKGEKRKDLFRVGVDGNVGWVAENRQLLYVQDITADERYLPGWLDRGSELVIPLMVGEEVLGVIDFERDEVNGFTPDEIRFLSLFANQVAWALYNVKLFEEIKKANEDLNRMSEMKSQFVSLVSHELRTPMTAIKGSLDIIHGGAAGPIHEKQKMFISMARRNIDRLKEMVNNILDLSRIEAGKIEFEFREVDFQEPLNHVLLTLSATADENKVVLESHLPSELPTLYADEAKVEQILTNLIGNALKHTPPGGKVTVVAGMAVERDMDRLKQVGKEVPSPDRYIRISVVDTGSGIPDDQLDAIFDRYKQLQGTKGEQGTGLGLAICRYMVEKQNGTVWAERGARVGSVLSFLLPVYQGENPTHVNKQGSMSPTSSS
jgi:PAS domain S-box-containing protein